MRAKLSLNRNITSTPLTYLTGHSNKIFVRILFAFNSCYVILIEWTFYCFVMSTTVCVNSNVQITFFLVIRLNKLSFAYCNTCNLLFSPLKFQNGLKNHVRNISEITYGFVKLVVIFLLIIKCNFVITSLILR